MVSLKKKFSKKQGIDFPEIWTMLFLSNFFWSIPLWYLSFDFSFFIRSFFIDALFLSGYYFCFFETKWKKIAFSFLSFLTLIRFLALAYVGSLQGMFERVPPEDKGKMLDSGLKLLFFDWTLLVLVLGVIGAHLFAAFYSKNESPKKLNLRDVCFYLLTLCFYCAYSLKSEFYPAPEVEYKQLDKKKYYFGTSSVEALQKTNLLEKDKGHFKGKNFIFFILESVGKSNIESPLIQNALSQLESDFHLSKLYFTDVTNIFPATTRSHLALNTGGLALTNGSLKEELVEMSAPPHLSQSFYESGYKTAVISATDWRFENLNLFYRKLKWDQIIDFHQLDPDVLKESRQNSWGFQERPFIQLMEKTINEWTMASAHGKKSPFFITFLNNNTHHPYASFNALTTDRSKETYEKALLEMISHFRTVLTFLREKHLLENTVIGFTGDHGEAFGDIHPGNFIHRNHLFQENIGNQLTLLYVSPDGNPKEESRNHSIAQGDLFPTLVDIFDLKKQTITPFFGNSYYDFKEKLHFFHKNTSPEMWGLRDGEWKYMESRFGSEIKYLFHLKNDPFEKHNLATQFKSRTQIYHALCTEWFYEKRNEFLTSTGFPADALGGFKMSLKKGVQAIVLLKEDKDRESEAIHSVDRKKPLHFLLLTTVETDKRRVRLTLTSPSDSTFSFNKEVEPEWRRVWVNPELPLPLEVGKWSVEVNDDGVKTKMEFEVHE